LPSFATTSTAWHPITPAPVPEFHRAERGVIDTPVVFDLDRIQARQLPGELAVSAITLAELAAGPHATDDADERARRQDRRQRAEGAFDPLPFDVEAARAYGRIYAAELARGRKARGPRALDLLIAAIACAAGLPMYTRNPDDFEGIPQLVDIVAI
jgi:predicted nucleic acid-binding protein